MTREQLAALDPNKVRKDKALFTLFKKYATEDAAQVFPGGKLPSGCFGCSFSKHFATWRRNFLPQQEEKRMSSKKTYELNDPNYRVYFKGRVLDKNSSNEEWDEWANHPSDKTKRQKRAEQFKKAPTTEVEVKPKKTRAKKTEPEETAPEVNNETPETNE